MRPYVLVLAAAAVLAAPRLRAQERLVLQERTAGAISGMRYAPDGSRLAVNFGSDFSVRVYPAAGGKPVIIPRGHDGAFLPWFTADGRALVCRTADQGIKVFDAATGAERQSLTGPGHTGLAVVSPDRRSLAVASSDGDLRLCLYDLATLRERHVLQRGAVAVSALALSPDGRTLATFHRPGTVRVWKGGKEWDRFDVGADPYTPIPRLTFSPDGAMLAVGRSLRTLLRDLAGRKTRGEVPANASFTPDGAAVVAPEVVHVRFWDLTGRELLAAPLEAQKGLLDLLPTAGGRAFVARFRDGEVALREASGDAAKPYKRSVVLLERPGAEHLAVTPDGRTALVAAADGRLRFFDTDPKSETFGKELAAGEAKAPGRLSALVVSPDGRRAAAVLAGGAARLWDVPARREIGDALFPPPFASVFRFNADGSVFTAAGNTGVRRWEVATGKPLGPAPAPAVPVLATSLVAFPATANSLAGLGTVAQTVQVLSRLEAEHDGRFQLTMPLAAGGDVLATADLFGRLRLIDLATDKETELQKSSSLATALAFAPDGKLLATSHGDRQLRTWDPSTGTGQPAGEPMPGSGPSAYSLLFSPDGQRVLAPVWGQPALVRDLKAGKWVALEASDVNGFNQPRFSADGAAVHADDYNSSRRSWDAATGLLLPPPAAGRGSPATVVLVRASPDGKHVAAGLSDGNVLVWATARPEEEPRPLAGGSPGGVKDLSFSPDGKVLAAAGMDGVVRLWDPTTGKLLKELRHHTQRVAQLLFSPDGKTLLAEAGDQSGSLWNADPSSAAFGKLLAPLPDLRAQGETGVQAWAPDGKTVAALNFNRVPRTFDPATGAVRRTLPEHNADVRQMAFAADSQTLLVRTASGRVYTWDAQTGKEVALPAGFPATAAAFAASADGWLAAAKDDRVSVWAGPGGKPVEFDAPGRPQALAFAPDGKTLAAAGASVRLWRRAKAGWEEAAAPGKPADPDGGPWSAVEVSADGRVLLLRSLKNELIYWDVEAGKGAAAAPSGGFAPTALLVPGKPPLALVHSGTGAVSLGNPLDRGMVRLYTPTPRVTGSVTSPDGRTTLTGSSDGAVRWYAADDPAKAVRTLDAHTSGIARLALSPDGKRLLTARYDGEVKLWDVSGEPKLLQTNTLPGLSAAEWAPDGKSVAAGTNTGELEVWDVPGGERRTLQRGAAQVASLALSRDGRTLAARDGRSTVRVYDTGSGAALMSVSQASAVALSPDGNVLATTDAAGAVRLHEARTGKERGKLAGVTAQVGNAVLLFSPDSRTLSITGRDNSVRHWDLAANAEGAKFPWCNPMIFSGDSRLRIGVTAAGQLTVWDAATGQQKGEGWPARAWQLTASADGKLVLLSGGGGSQVKLFDVAGGGEPAALFKEGAYLNPVLLTPDGKTAVAVADNSQLRFWDVARGAERPAVVLRNNYVVLRNNYFGNWPMAVTEDSRSLVVPIGAGGVKIWDIQTGRERASLAPPPGGSYVMHFALSADGSTLAVSYNDGSLRVLDVRTAPERGALAGHVGPVTAVAVSADGKLAATAGEDRTVRLFDPAAPSRPATVVLRGASSAVLGVAVAPDGRTVAGASADGTVRLWPRDAREELLTLRGHGGWAYRVVYLPDGKRALSSGGEGLRLWDLEKGVLVRAFAPGRASFALGVSPDGKRCLSGDAANMVRLYDVETGKELREFKGHTRYVWVALFLPGGKEVLTSGYDGKVFTWDPETGEKKREFEATGDSPRCGALSPDGKRLATGDTRSGGKGGTLRVWDLESGKPLRSFGDYAGEVASVAWAPDGKRLLATAFDGTVRVWDPETGKELKRMKQPTSVDWAAWLPDGKRLISTANDGDNSVHLWDVESGKELRRFAGHTAAPVTVAVAPDGNTALTTGKDGMVRQWNLRRIDPVVLSGHEGEVWSAAFAPDGKLLATAGADKTVRLWDVSSDRERPGYGRPVRKLEGAAAGIFSVAFSTDGKRLAAGEGDLFATQPGAVRLWDVGSGELLATLKGHTAAVRAVAFSPDGKLLATGGADKTIRLWDARDGQSKGVLSGHATAVMGLAFDAAGGLLASAGANPMTPAEGGEVLLWDVATGRQRGPLVGHRTGLTAVAISPDGTSLFGAGYDETVRIWTLPRPSP